jgi:alcohol dehydrogenase (quinone), cytochrome c subunit
MRSPVIALVLVMTAGVALGAEDAPGRYIAALGDCAACHTAPHGKPFAGGLAMKSPFGVIYATNITPDPTHGIGSYTLEEFARAVREGIRKNGANLYPAMPYTSFAKVSDEDIETLYDHFMNDVAPVAEAAPRTDLSFPFDQRWGLDGWNMLNRPELGFSPPFEDEILIRGAYLVEGLGHCGACHTRRDILEAQEAYEASDDRFLSGGTVGAWSVPDLRGPTSAPQQWSEDELIAYLTTGRNLNTGATGDMGLVVEHSLQHATAADVEAIARYLKAIGTDALNQARTAKTDRTTAMLTAASPDMPLGARLYLDNCGACHTVSGRGAPRVFPNLVGNSVVMADQPGGFIEIVLAGAAMPSTAGAPAALAMPGFAGRLSDSEVAALVSFIRNAWANQASEVDEAIVRGIREGL